VPRAAHGRQMSVTAIGQVNGAPGEIQTTRPHCAGTGDDVRYLQMDYDLEVLDRSAAHLEVFQNI